MMVEVPRRSTFPPILQDYPPGSNPRAKPSRPVTRGEATAGGRRLLGGEKATKTGKARRARVKVRDGAATTKLQSVSDKFKKEEAVERRRKREKRAEATVRCWDALLQREREEKYSVLKQRVHVQHQLISKKEELTEQLRANAEGERMEKLQSRRAVQKEMVQSLRTHMQRIEEHKKMIAEKLRLLESGSPVNRPEGEITTPGDSPATIDARRDNAVSVPEVLLIEEGDDQLSGDEDISPRTCKGTQTALTQLLGIDPEAEEMPTVESMWGGLKANTTRRLRPAVVYSRKLKEISSPSVKHCLSVYEKPTMHDRYTGKPVPLTEVLNETTQTRTGGLQADRRVAMELSARRNQRRADIMLSKKEMPLAEDRPLEWYTDDPQLPHHQSVSVKATELSHSEPNCKPQSEFVATVSTRMGKRRPKFLTKSDSLLTCSLEELGSDIYLKPSSRHRRDNDMDGHTGSGSVFLTDFRLEDEISTSSQLKESRNTSPRDQRRCPRWQPLSSGALSEHRGVAALPVNGLGHLAHGKYKLWRPRQAVS